MPVIARCDEKIAVPKIDDSNEKNKNIDTLLPIHNNDYDIMKCPNCGQKVPKNRKICHSCGCINVHWSKRTLLLIRVIIYSPFWIIMLIVICQFIMAILGRGVSIPMWSD
jgi:hypothetical protein